MHTFLYKVTVIFPYDDIILFFVPMLPSKYINKELFFVLISLPVYVHIVLYKYIEIKHFIFFAMAYLIAIEQLDF